MASDDVLRDGDLSYRITLQAAASADWHYSLAHRSDALIVNVDDDLTAPGISVTPNLTPGATLLTTTEAVGAASFRVVLNTRPTFLVTMGLLSSDTSEGVVAPTSLVFTAANWNVPQVVTVTAVDARAADKVDLLTVIEHELGHVAGLRDLDASATSLMSGSIATGIRRNATAREVDAIFGKLS